MYCTSTFQIHIYNITLETAAVANCVIMMIYCVHYTHLQIPKRRRCRVIQFKKEIYLLLYNRTSTEMATKAPPFTFFILFKQIYLGWGKFQILFPTFPVKILGKMYIGGRGGILSYHRFQLRCERYNQRWYGPLPDSSNFYKNKL